MSAGVVWLNARRLCWDQTLVDDMLNDPLPVGGPVAGVGHEELPDEKFAIAVHQTLMPIGDGAVLVVPARYYQPAPINALIAPWEWAVVLLTSDEESTFPWAELRHPNMHLWVMTPRPAIHGGHDHLRFLGEGYGPETRHLLAREDGPGVRPVDVSFAGQVTHKRREQAVAALNGIAKRGDTAVEVYPSPGFLQGLNQPTYLHLLHDSKLVAAPSGPATPDSFRAYEALEAGAVPIVDDRAPSGVRGYWRTLFGEDHPLPVIEEWAGLPGIVERELDAWPANANRVASWWMRQKRADTLRLADDVAEVSGRRLVIRSRVDDLVTVIVTSSPIPSNPDTRIIDETLATVRHHLPRAEILLTLDGVRAEQRAARWGAYEEWQRHVLWAAARGQWGALTPVRSDAHRHQGEMTRLALDLVRTPVILFVEHDTPLVTDEPIDLPGIVHAVATGALDLVRLHHEAHVLEPHEYLMIDRIPIPVGGVPVLRTRQWSQRPHFAGTGYYRRILDRHLAGRTAMIEDVMHGVVQGEPWGAHRLALYAPPGGNIKRSLHLDGREGDPKWGTE